MGLVSGCIRELLRVAEGLFHHVEGTLPFSHGVIMDYIGATPRVKLQRTVLATLAEALRPHHCIKKH